MANTLEVSFPLGPAYALIASPGKYGVMAAPVLMAQTGIQNYAISAAVGNYVESGESATLVPVPGGSAFYVLPSSRIVTWAPGLSYCPTSGNFAPTAPPSGWTGGIPVYTQYGSTYSPSGSDDTAAINSLLSSAGAVATQASPRYVKLAIGHFIISGLGLLISSSYVYLIGSGPGPGMSGALVTATYVSANAGTATLLVKTDGSPYSVVYIGSVLGDPTHALNTFPQSSLSTSDMTAGSNTCTLSTPSSVSGMAVGELVFVNELYDSTYTWYNINGQGTGYFGAGEGAQAATPATSRPVGQAMEVSSFNSSTGVVTFTTAFSKTYRASFSAHLGRIAPAHRTNWSGVANLFCAGGGGGDGGGQILIGSAMYCWVQNVEVSGHSVGQYGGGLIHIMNSFRCEVRDSYFHSDSLDIPNISPGGAYYNMVYDSYTSDCLIENNISWIANKIMVMRGCGSGNVVSYNYMDDGYGNTYPNQMEAALNSDHMTTTHHTLFEGNYSWELQTDSRWGNSLYSTWFRNWGSTQRVSAWTGISPTSCAYQNPLTTYVYNEGGGMLFYYEDEYNRAGGYCGSHHLGFNYVGNVLTLTGLPLLTDPQSYYKVPQTGYAYEWLSSGSGVVGGVIPVWWLGQPDPFEGTLPGNGLDSSVPPVTLRDANYDYFTNAVHWHGIGGSGTGQTTPPGASVTGGSTLPSSMYLPSKPAFFYNQTWPWIDGSNASTPIPGTLPAMVRFQTGAPNLPVQAIRPSYNTGTGLFVLNGGLYDSNGRLFVMQGLNIDDAYTSGGSGSLTTSAAGMAAANCNCIRFNVYQNFSLSVMVAQANSAIANSQVPIVTVQNIVGSSGTKLSGNTSTTDLQNVVTQWNSSYSSLSTTSFNKHLIINIANEWGPSNSTTWRDTYISAVSSMRTQGYTCPLMIDSGGFGQDSGDLLNYAQAIFNSDPQKNIIFTIHLYSTAGTAISGSPNLLQQLYSQGIAQGMVFAVMEFGSSIGAGSPTTPTQIINASNSAGLGWAAWAWDDPIYALPGDPYQMTETQGLFTGTPATASSSAQLTTYGQQVVPFFATTLKATDFP
jgi:Cellulase (glycosyl hydrolase family 5)